MIFSNLSSEQHSHLFRFCFKYLCLIRWKILIKSFVYSVKIAIKDRENERDPFKCWQWNRDRGSWPRSPGASHRGCSGVGSLDWRECVHTGFTLWHLSHFILQTSKRLHCRATARSVHLSAPSCLHFLLFFSKLGWCESNLTCLCNNCRKVNRRSPWSSPDECQP